MQIQPINQHNQHFGNKFRLNEKSIKLAEKTTGLTYKEMTTLSIENSRKLMIERGTLKKPSKLKQWCANKYRQIGEKLGLLEKEHNIYTDIH